MGLSFENITCHHVSPTAVFGIVSWSQREAGWMRLLFMYMRTSCCIIDCTNRDGGQSKLRKKDNYGLQLLKEKTGNQTMVIVFVDAISSAPFISGNIQCLHNAVHVWHLMYMNINNNYKYLILCIPLFIFCVIETS